MRHPAYRHAVVLAHAIVSSWIVGACASATSFDKALDEHRWSDAASRFDSDTSLHQNEHALFHAAMLYSFPDRSTYDPARARELFNRLLQLYPSTQMRQTSIDHLALLNELQRAQADAQARERTYETQIAQLSADTLRLHVRLDTLNSRLQSEQDQSARIHKLESDLRDRENQLHNLDTELAQLKAIDLKPSLRPKASDSTKHSGQTP